jgi:chemotaxis signal transduction protein
VGQKFIIVSIARQKKLVRLSVIQEIVSLMALTEIDERRGLCRGMANLRGESIPVFDLSGPRERLSPSRFIVMARVHGQTIGLIVDEVHDVVTVPEAQLSPRPVGEGSSILVARLDDELMSILEPAYVLRDAG